MAGLCDRCMLREARSPHDLLCDECESNIKNEPKVLTREEWRKLYLGDWDKYDTDRAED